MVLATGDFFGPSSDGSSDEELTELLADKLEGWGIIVCAFIAAKTTSVPIQVYAMQGEHPLPQVVIEKAQASGGQLCTNVYLLSALNFDCGRPKTHVRDRQIWDIVDCTWVEDSLSRRNLCARKVLWEIKWSCEW